MVLLAHRCLWDGRSPLWSLLHERHVEMEVDPLCQSRQLLSNLPHGGSLGEVITPTPDGGGEFSRSIERQFSYCFCDLRTARYNVCLLLAILEMDFVTTWIFKPLQKG